MQKVGTEIGKNWKTPEFETRISALRERGVESPATVSGMSVETDKKRANRLENENGRLRSEIMTLRAEVSRLKYELSLKK